MFRFFTERNWFIWSWLGSAIILSSLWIQVKIDVKINEWFGEFYDMIQKALGAPNAITIEEYWASLLSFIIFFEPSFDPSLTLFWFNFDSSIFQISTG